MQKPAYFLKVSFLLAALLATAGVPPSGAFAASRAATAPTLGAAGSFAVLGASAVTNTGPTVLNGDLGIHPNNASSITGFPPGLVKGATHAADAVALQAQNDATTAYNALKSQACDFDLSGQDLGGKTLVPGVYCFSSSAQLTGQLTLTGLATDVWVFKIGSTLTTASASSVVLAGGASPCNVFWQVGSSATLGTTTRFAGNILALASITMNTGANLSGDALARTGAVTLDTNTISSPICAAAPRPPTAPPTNLPTPTPGLPPTFPKTGDGPLSNPAAVEWPALALVAAVCGVVGWLGWQRSRRGRTDRP